MELNTILKPELIVIATLVLLVIAGAASAAEVKMIDPENIKEVVMGYLWFVFEFVLAAGTLWGAILLIAAHRNNNPDKKLQGIALCGVCLLALIIVYVMPWLLQDIEDAATTATINASAT